jgi:uncharacterized Zn finger protein
MTRERSKNDLFKELTWGDLRDWAGSTIVSRGRTYHRDRLVQSLARTPSGGVIAWVYGTHRYATWVDFGGGTLISACSCPYGGTCKHAVAVVIEFLEHLKKNVEIPKVNGQDVRMGLLEEFSTQNRWDEGEGTKSDDAGSWLPRVLENPSPNFSRPFWGGRVKRSLSP